MPSQARRPDRQRPEPARVCRGRFDEQLARPTRRSRPQARGYGRDRLAKPSTRGTPSARATMAACPVDVPPAIAMPATNSRRTGCNGRRVEVGGDQHRGCPSARHRSGLRSPRRSAATRRPTSRTSAARSRKKSSSTPARPSAWPRRDAHDRVSGTARRQRPGRTPVCQDARVACEQGLCLEDRADLLTGAACRLVGQLRQVVGSRLEGRSKSGSFGRLGQLPGRHQRARRGSSRPADTTRSERPTPTPGAAGPADEHRSRRPGPGHSPRHPLQSLPTTSASARIRRAAEVAPGSWWPIDRSPR